MKSLFEKSVRYLLRGTRPLGAMHKRYRTLFKYVAFINALLLALPAVTNGAEVSKPNILLILADDMGWGDLGCHGNDKLDTPSLDNLHRQSVQLEQFYVSPVCSPTRSSLLTGRHHFRLRVLNTTSGLEVMHGDEITLAEALNPAGYVSGCFGKWHNGANHPSTARGQGFDEFFGFVGGFFSNYFDPKLEHNGVTAVRNGYITDVLADAAMAFIERHRSGPFFCYVPFNAPHSPMQAPADLFEKYTQLGFEPKTAAVYAMVENLDANVGRMLAKLDALGLAENTIVMFASDNGPNTPRFNGVMRGGKGSLFEGGQRVPCFVRWPGKLESGRRVKRIAQHIDVLPTLLELADVPLPETLPLDGLSLAPLLRGDSAEWPERLLFEVSGRGGKDGTPIPKHPGTVRSDTHRWVHDNKQEMLFDLRNDPGEKNNVAAAQPDVAVQLSRAYDEWFDQAVAATEGRAQRFPITLDEETELLAPYAAREGDAKFYGKGWDNDWVVFPTDTAAAFWKLDVTSAGQFEVIVMHTAKTSIGKIRVSIGESQVEVPVTDIHDPPEIPRPDLFPRWEVPDKAFAPLRLGVIGISSGEQTLQLTATPGVEIQSVRLRRVEKEAASLRLPSMISDHMVLQSEQAVTVWGWAVAAESVTVDFAGQSKTATTTAEGKWTVQLDPLAASAESRELRVRTASGETRVVRDVIVGEVWLGGGQSNLGVEMSKLPDYAEEVATASNPLIREYMVIPTPSLDGPRDDVPGFWRVVRPGSTSAFSALGYFFMKDLHRELKTPVAFINDCWGGTRIEPWLSAEAVAALPALAAESASEKDGHDTAIRAMKAWLKQTGREDQPLADVEAFTVGPVSPDDGWIKAPNRDEIDLPGVPKHGAFWFRRQFQGAPELRSAPQRLLVAPFAMFEKVYWNGELIGETNCENRTSDRATRWHYYISPDQIRDGVNELAVRVFAPVTAPGFAWPPGLGGRSSPGEWSMKVERALPPLNGLPPAPPLNARNLGIGSLFNGMIHPILPYSIRGVVWYQGESNTRNPQDYRERFPALIRDWRRHWNAGEFPFYFCQLANFRGKATKPGESSWAELREAQALALALPNTGMAVLIDTGESEDIHPLAKDVAGSRLARIALAKTYDKAVSFSGPIYQAMKIEGDRIRLTFRHIEGGLVAKEVPATYDVMRKTSKTAPLLRNRPNSQLEGFAICGENKQWVWADAKIDGDTVLVWSDQVTSPVAVRYAWADNPICNLYNTAGLPAAPLRTDAVTH
jgi:sialate O-acetylesterase